MKIEIEAGSDLSPTRVKIVGAHYEVIVEDAGDGVYILAPSVSTNTPIALVDFFYGAPYGSQAARNSQLDGPPVQVVLYDPHNGEDPIAYSRIYPDGARIGFECSVSEIDHSPLLHERAFGVVPEAVRHE